MICLYFVSFVILVSSSGVQSDNIFKAKAITEIAEKFYAKNNHRIDILCFNCKSYESSNLIDKIVGRVQRQTLSFKVVGIEYQKKIEYELTTSTILIFETLKDYNFFSSAVEWRHKTSTLQLHHLVHILSKSTVNKPPTDIKSIDIDFLDDVSETSINLSTFIYYSKQHCNKPQLTTINTFSKTHGKWKNNDFFPRRFSNMNACPLDFSVEYKPKSFEMVFQNEKWKYSGSIFEIHDSITKKLNINVVYWPYKYDKKEGAVYFRRPPKVETLLYPALLISYEDPYIQLESFKFDYRGFLIPPGHPYTQLEKMFLMFDPDVWMWLGISLGLGLLAIQLLNFCSKRVQEVFYGEGVQTPTLNYFAVICGIGQIVLPHKDFARFILMLFIIFCLIFRTCHQSMLFSLLQADIRGPEVRTLDEAIDHGFTFHMNAFNERQFRESEFMGR